MSAWWTDPKSEFGSDKWRRGRVHVLILQRMVRNFGIELSRVTPHFNYEFEFEDSANCEACQEYSCVLEAVVGEENETIWSREGGTP